MLRRTHPTWGALLLTPLIAGTGNVQAQGAGGEAGKVIQMVRAQAIPTIDGRLDEDLWANAALVEDLYESSPNEFAKPSEHTQIYLSYDDDALYVGLRAWDSEPDKVHARILRHGERFGGDDFFAVVLDPFNSQRGGYVFATNPNGARDDALYQNTTEMVFDWDGIYQAAATQNDQGWVAEMAIPFKTLSFDEDNDTWGINFSRTLARRGERISWVSRNRAFPNPSITGLAVGFTDLEQGLGLDIVPSVSLNRRRSFSPSDSTSNTEPSMDVFYKLTPSLNASLTVNTDFSATEVDDRQVNLTRFNLFFPEKRDFFLQDTDIFQFGGIGGQSGFGAMQNTAASRPSLESGRPFFSRQIGIGQSGEPVDLNYGGKLSGRVGRWDVGALAIRQDDLQDVEATDIFVGRVAANLLAESSAGMVVTSGDPKSNLDNTLVGMDFRYVNTRLPGGRTLRAEVWYQQTETDALKGEDSAFGVSAQMPNTAGFRWGGGIKEIQENFKPALGFVDRVGVRDHTLELGYTKFFQGRFLRSIFSGVDAQRIDHLDGGLQSQVFRVRALELENNTQDKLKLQYTANQEVLQSPFEISEGIAIPTGQYSFDEYGFELEAGNQRKLSGKFTYRAGDFFNGERLNLIGELAWNPSTHFRSSIRYDVNDVDLPQGDFVTRLVRLKLEVIFSSEWSWVNIIQYDNVTDTGGINSRLHWIPEAGREAFVVLNHNLKDRNQDDDFHSTLSDLAIKFNYTFRF